MANEKIKSYAQGESHTATSFGVGVYFLDSQAVEETRSVAYDKAAYLQGVQMAATAYITEVVHEFAEKAK